VFVSNVSQQGPRKKRRRRLVFVPPKKEGDPGGQGGNEVAQKMRKRKAIGEAPDCGRNGLEGKGGRIRTTLSPFEKEGKKGRKEPIIHSNLGGKKEGFLPLPLHYGRRGRIRCGGGCQSLLSHHMVERNLPVFPGRRQSK